MLKLFRKRELRLSENRYYLVLGICLSLFPFLPENIQADELLNTSSSPLGAESDANHFLEIERKNNKIERSKLVIPRNMSKKEELPPEVENFRFFLEKLHLTGITLIDEKKVEALKHEYEKKQTSIGQLYELVAKINKMYTDKGYFTCLAILPKQKIVKGNVRIKVIEGKLGHIKLEGNKYTRSRFIKKQLGLPVGEAPKIDKLNDKFKTFNTLRDIQLDPSFAPGKAVGTTDITVKTKEDKKYSGQVYVDNYAAKTNGQGQVGIIFKNTSLTGRADPFMLGLSSGKKSRSLFMNYRFPLSLKGTLSGSYSYSRNEVIEEPAASLDIHGESNFANFTYTHVVKAWDPSLFQWRIGVDLLDNESYVGIVATDVKAQRISAGVDYATVRKHDELFTSITATHATNNTKGFAGDIDDSTKRINLAASYKLKNASGAYATYKGRIHATGDRRVPTTEQWTAGGYDSVRVLEPAAVSGDRGWDSRLNIGWSKPLLAGGISNFDVSLFYEKARVKSDQDLGLDNYTFDDRGVELSMTLIKKADLSLIWSDPVDLPSQLKEGNKLLARLNVNF